MKNQKPESEPGKRATKKDAYASRAPTKETPPTAIIRLPGRPSSGFKKKK